MDTQTAYQIEALECALQAHISVFVSKGGFMLVNGNDNSIIGSSAHSILDAVKDAWINIRMVDRVGYDVNCLPVSYFN